MSKELKPCPLCGRKPIIEHWSSGGTMFMVKCNNPDCPEPAKPYPKGHRLNEVIAVWNRRRTMGRVIDAGLVLDNLSGRLESMKDYDAVKDVINNMPTAYDPDKVVEQLEERSKEYNSGVRLHGKPEEMLTEDAIEIVRGGGKND